MTSILVIHQSAELYGSDKTLLILLSRLDKALFTPVVVLPFDGPLKTELEKEGIKVVIAPVLKLYRKMFTPGNLWQLFKGVRQAIKILDGLHQHYKFDMVYSNTLAVLLGMVYAKKRKLRHIWHVHEIIVHPKIIANIFPVLLYRYSDVVVCNSYATQKNLTDRKPALSKKCMVIHNGLNPEYAETTEKAHTRAGLGFLDTDIVITLLGRIGRFKGHKWLLNTYVKHLSNSNAKIVFVGSPVPGQEYHQEELEQIIRENSLENKVKIIPFTTNLKSIWNLTDIAAVPSVEPEPFGLVAVEAMLAKKPVVAANHGGLTEIVVNNTTGFLITPSNETELFTALDTLIKNPVLRKSFGEEGYSRAIAQFSQQSYVDRFTQLFIQKIT